MSPETDDQAERARLRAALVEEVLALSPFRAMRTMRRWPAGAISLVHLHVLHVLDVDGPLPMRALAEALDVSQASTTGIVDRMEQRGLVTRVRDSSDRRVVRVELTSEGRGMVSGSVSEHREVVSEALESLSDRDLEGFVAGVRALREARERHLQRGHARSTSAERR
jgi:DNA-binding MarR family transcriptional regulator